MNPSDPETNESPQQQWQRATTFSELCELTKQFIEGKLPYMPTYGGSIDSETIPLARYLAKLNESGLLTTDSQPGLSDDEVKQRAYVTGFALKDTALRIAKLCLYTELYVSVFRPGSGNVGSMIPVTVADFRPYTWVGMAGFEDIDAFRVHCSETTMNHLEKAWHVTVIDLVWGREDYLWKTLIATPDDRYSVKPHPDLELPDDMDIYTS